MVDASALLHALGISNPSGPLDESIRLRIDTPLRLELDRIEALVRGAGYRDISRSDLIRSALNSFVKGFREEVPELADVVLPEEQHIKRTDKVSITHPA